MTTLQRNRGKVRAFARMMKVADWIASIPARVTPPPFRLIQIGSAFWQSRALYVATRLGLADALGDGERHTCDLAAELGLHEDHLHRLMRMLASIGVFDERAERRFANSRSSAYLRRDHPRSVRAMILMHNDPLMTRPWTEALEGCIRSGEVPFERVNGQPLYEYMSDHPEFDQLFSSAMDAVEGVVGTDYLQDFDWGRFERVIDVGGSNGSKALAILKANPGLRALVFDRPSVVGSAELHWAGRAAPELLARLEFAGGDMFEALPAPRSERDVYFFMAVFHGLGDDESGRLLQSLRRALGRTRATAVVVDTVVDPARVDPAIASFDMQMLMGTRGRERSLEQWTTLFAEGGFAIQEVVQVRSFARFIVIRPV